MHGPLKTDGLMLLNAEKKSRQKWFKHYMMFTCADGCIFFCIALASAICLLIMCGLLVLFSFACISLSKTYHFEFFRLCGRGLWTALAIAVTVPIWPCLFSGIVFWCCRGYYGKSGNVFLSTSILYYLASGVTLISLAVLAQDDPICMEAMAEFNTKNNTYASTTVRNMYSPTLTDTALAYGCFEIFLSLAAAVMAMCVWIFCNDD